MTAPLRGTVSVPVPWSDQPFVLDLDDEHAVALMRNRAGEPVDVAQNVETATSMVLEGYVAEVLRPDPWRRDLDVAALQRALDADQAAYEDCWGVAPYFATAAA